MPRALLTMVCCWIFGGSPSLGQVKLEQKYLPNTQAVTNESFELTAKVQIAGQNVDIAASSRQTQRAEFLPPADNLVPIKITITSAALSTSANGQNYTFDSALAPPPKSDNPEFNNEVETLRALIDNPLTYQIGGDGHVNRVDGAQAIISKAPAEAVKGLEARLTEQRLKDEFKQQVRLVPDTPVQAGDGWKRTEQIPIQGGSTLAIDRSYEFVGTITKDGRQVEHIKITDEVVRLMLGNNDIGLTLKEADLKVNSTDGAMYFDRELGAIVERTVTTRVSGKVTLLANGSDLPLDLDLKFTTSSIRQR